MRKGWFGLLGLVGALAACSGTGSTPGPLDLPDVALTVSLADCDPMAIASTQARIVNASEDARDVAIENADPEDGVQAAGSPLPPFDGTLEPGAAMRLQIDAEITCDAEPGVFDRYIAVGSAPILADIEGDLDEQGLHVEITIE